MGLEKPAKPKIPFKILSGMRTKAKERTKKNKELKRELGLVQKKKKPKK